MAKGFLIGATREIRRYAPSDYAIPTKSGTRECGSLNFPCGNVNAGKMDLSFRDNGVPATTVVTGPPDGFSSGLSHASPSRSVVSLIRFIDLIARIYDDLERAIRPEAARRNIKQQVHRASRGNGRRRLGS